MSKMMFILCNIKASVKAIFCILVLMFPHFIMADEPFKMKEVFISKENASEFGVEITSRVNMGVVLVTVDLRKHTFCDYEKFYVVVSVLKGLPSVPSYNLYEGKLFLAVNESYYPSLRIDFRCKVKNPIDIGRYIFTFEHEKAPELNSTNNNFFSRIKSFFNW